MDDLEREPASIEIRVKLGDVVVHEFRRASTLHNEKSLGQMFNHGLGWLQAYSGQATARQLLMEARRVLNLRRET